MKGGDRGIDGVITVAEVKNGKQNYSRVLVQVKGGNVGSGDLRDFRGTIEREKALGGIFITLHSATKPMLKEAVEAGTFTYALTNQKYPTIQIITVEDLLRGVRPNLPNVVGYAKAAAASKYVSERQTLL